MEALKVIKPKRLSLGRSFKPGLIPTLKRHQYQVEYGRSIMGDQPKQFIRVYEYEEGADRRKIKPKTWPLYIAKTAEKWYPNESITEHLLNRIGECWRMPMAESRLVWANGQVRFLSLYFLNDGCEELTHGADILAGFFNDRTFIKEIERLKKEREFISVHLFQEALAFIFPDHHIDLFRGFVRMLLLDALVGNNDRHFWNYGVIRDVIGQQPPRFSPVFDTARGLYWNTREEEIVVLQPDKQRRDQNLNKYVRKSQPKMSWDGVPNITHIEMVNQIAETELGVSMTEIREFYHPAKLAPCIAMIDREFTGLFSPERLDMIKRCLSMRLELINNIL